MLVITNFANSSTRIGKLRKLHKGEKAYATNGYKQGTVTGTTVALFTLTRDGSGRGRGIVNN